MAEDEKREAKNDRRDRGCACPTCGCPDSTVYYTRRIAGRIRRRRQCEHCGRLFTTSESVRG